MLAFGHKDSSARNISEINNQESIKGYTHRGIYCVDRANVYLQIVG